MQGALRLRALRIWIGGYALLYTLARLPELWRVAHYPASELEPTGLARFVLPAPLVIGIAIATCVLLGAFVAGWRYRIVAPLAALGLVFVFSYRSAWGQVFHTENLMVLHVCVLALVGKRFAVAWITLAWAFHVGVLLLMWIVFPYPLLGFAFLPLLPAEKLLPAKLRL